MQDRNALFQRFLRGQCSLQEAEQLLDFFSGPNGDPELVRLIEQELNTLSSQTGSDVPFAVADNLEKLRSKLASSKRRPKVYRLWPYAAAVVLAIAVGVWTWPWADGGAPQRAATEAIVPGGNRATLMLADGSEVKLSETYEEIEIGEEIVYSDGKPVAGTEAVDPKSGAAGWLSLTTLRGGTYRVTLADGTRVWLNAASTLKYPGRFDGAERVVSLEGEGYFEVAKDPGKPFRVINARQQVVVLGTAFNIASYADEAEIKTTLVEGKVSVLSNQLGNPMSVVLLPAEQSLLVGGQLTKRGADVDVEIAWRDGFIAFREEKLGDIMRKVARWYDVGVALEDGIAARTFSGTVSRYADINELLETLALTEKVQFEVKDRTITVKSK